MFINSPTVLCPAPLGTEITLKPFFGFFPMHKSKDHTTCCLSRLYLFFHQIQDFYQKYTENSSYLLHSHQLIVLNLLSPTNISVSKCPFNSCSAHITSLSAALFWACSYQSISTKLPAQLFPEDLLCFCCFPGNKTYLLTLHCKFCWEKAVPSISAGRTRTIEGDSIEKKKIESVDLGPPRWGCAISLPWSTARTSRLLDWVLQAPGIFPIILSQATQSDNRWGVLGGCFG